MTGLEDALIRDFRFRIGVATAGWLVGAGLWAASAFVAFFKLPWPTKLPQETQSAAFLAVAVVHAAIAAGFALRLRTAIIAGMALGATAVVGQFLMLPPPRTIPPALPIASCLALAGVSAWVFACASEMRAVRIPLRTPGRDPEQV